MSDLLEALSRGDRRLIDKMALSTGVVVEALLPEIVSAYLRLMKDVPAAMPRDPMRGLSVAALRRVKKRQPNIEKVGDNNE